MFYLYHLSLVIGMLLRLVGLKECGLVTRSLGLDWPLSEVKTRVGALLLQSSTPHNPDIPSWCRDQNTTLNYTLVIYFIHFKHPNATSPALEVLHPYSFTPTLIGFDTISNIVEPLIRKIWGAVGPGVIDTADFQDWTLC